MLHKTLGLIAVLSLTVTSNLGRAADAPGSVPVSHQFHAPLMGIGTTGSIVNVHGSRDINQALTFEQWLQREAEISFTKMLVNIAPAGAAKGSVVASPSQKDPDYWYTWTRDSALTMSVLVDNYATSQGSDKARWFSQLNDYVTFSRGLQNQANAPTGLGDPKFYVDGTIDFDPWNRPQNDGPALRALTFTRWANFLINDNQLAFVQTNLYSNQIPAVTVIKADLEYVAHHWQDPSFDLWEEVRGDHFYTRIVQLAALRAGGDLANKLGDGGASAFYFAQADAIAKSLEQFWDGSQGHFVTTLNRVEGLDYKNSQLDAALVLGVLHAGFTGGEFSPADDRVLASAARLEDTFRGIYSINDPKRFTDVATAMGRYPEDTYSGQPNISLGNPWILNTAAMAELYYKVAVTIKNAGSFTINQLNMEFIQNATGPTLGTQNLANGFVVRSGSAEFGELIQKLTDRGDAFLKRVRLHANPDGSLWEQIDRNSGYMCSARDLTWSYASFITAFWARP